LFSSSLETQARIVAYNAYNKKCEFLGYYKSEYEGNFNLE